MDGIVIGVYCRQEEVDNCKNQNVKPVCIYT